MIKLKFMQEKRKQNLNDEVIKLNLEYIAKEVSEIKDKLDKDYVTKEDLLLIKSEFQPVKVIVYTITTVAGVAAISALVKLILK